MGFSFFRVTMALKTGLEALAVLNSLARI